MPRGSSGEIVVEEVGLLSRRSVLLILSLSIAIGAVVAILSPWLFGGEVRATALAVFSIDRRVPDGQVLHVDVPDARDRLAGYTLILAPDNYEISLKSNLILEVRSAASDAAEAAEIARSGIDETLNRILTFEKQKVPEAQERLILVAKSPVEITTGSPMETLARILSLTLGLLLITASALLLIRRR